MERSFLAPVRQLKATPALGGLLAVPARSACCACNSGFFTAVGRPRITPRHTDDEGPPRHRWNQCVGCHGPCSTRRVYRPSWSWRGSPATVGEGTVPEGAMMV